MTKNKIEEVLSKAKNYLGNIIKEEDKINNFVEKTKVEFSKNLNVMESVFEVLDLKFPSFKKAMEIIGNPPKDNREKYTQINNELYTKIMFMIKEIIFDKVIQEDIKYIIKKYPIMAFHKSNYLKIIFDEMIKYEGDKESKLKNKVELTKLQEKEYYRGRLFSKKDKNPYQENPDYPSKSLFQTPINLTANKGRFNIIGESYFYLADSKLGVYLELRKYKAENYDKNIYIQKFKTNKNISDILPFENFFGIYPTKINYDEFSKAIEKTKEYILESYDGYSAYSVSTYISAMAKATGFLGVYYTGVRQKMFNSNMYLELNNDKTYHNLTLFTNAFSKEIMDNNIEEITDKDRKRIEKKFYEKAYKKEECIFAETYVDIIGKPTVLEIDEVIEEFNDTVKIDDNGLLYLYDEDSYKFKVDFKTLKENIGKYLGRDTIFRFDINIEYCQFVFKKLLNEVKKELKNKRISRVLDFGDPEVQSNYSELLSLYSQVIKKDKSNLTDFIITLSEDFESVKKLEFTQKTKLKIIEEYIENFQIFFGVYYHLELNKNRNSVKLIDLQE